MYLNNIIIFFVYKSLELYMPQSDNFTFFTQIFWYFLINYFFTNVSSLLKLRINYLSSLKLNLINHINSMINLSLSKHFIKIKRFRKIIKKAHKYDITMMLSVIFQNKKIINNYYT